MQCQFHAQFFRARRDCGEKFREMLAQNAGVNLGIGFKLVAETRNGERIGG